MAKAIEAAGLAKRYPPDVQALDGLDLGVEEGTIFALLGPNGAGKSTPLTFLSSALMQANLVPPWVRGVSSFNPVNWAAQAGRSAAIGPADWPYVGQRIGLLVALLLVSSFLATRAFRAYQRSL
jgi:energy-coupling factor transporter ATP-binding protein EcfA2